MPVTKKMDDGSGRTATYEYNEETGEYSNPTNIHKGNKQNGLYEEWHDNGQLAKRINYKNGKFDGLFEEWYGDGQLASRVNYKNDKREGLSESWYEDGQLRVRGEYKNDKLEGDYEEWYSDGKLAERKTYNDDKSEGLYEKWYENGQLHERANFKNDKRDGVSEGWYSNGQLWYRENYKDGKLDGLHEEWYDGTLLARIEYKDGELVKTHDVNSDVRFRKGSELDQVNERFNRELDKLIANPQGKNRVLSLGNAGTFLRRGGIVDAEIELEFDKLVSKSNDKYKSNHPFDISDVHNLPLAVNAPIAVFNNTNSQNNDAVILTELQKDGRNFIVALRALTKNRKGGKVLTINEITSLYPKEVRGIISWINNGKATNIDKEKALRFIEALRPHVGTTITGEELSDAAKVVKDFENKEVRFRKKDFNRAVLSEQVRRSLEEQHYDRYVREQTKKLLGYDNKSKDVGVYGNLWLSYRLMRLYSVRKRGQSMI